MQKYYANLTWQDKTPKSILYDDVYFSTISGIEEAEYVFLKHNDLRKRFLQLKDEDIFIIAETGFGCGRNFLVTTKLWQETVTTTAKLFFISFEKTPLKPNDLALVLNNFVEFENIKQQLINQYNLILPATHRFTFANNVYLDLIIGDIKQTIFKCYFIANAWFLDGFNPHKNPEIWDLTILKQIAQLSKNGTTFATYSANSKLQKTLTQANFQVHKAQGLYKRNMLYGYKLEIKATEQLGKTRLGKHKPEHWFSTYQNINPQKKVAIIGGGISGAATAYSLAMRGFTVTLYEEQNKLAPLASGNYQGILYGNFFGNNASNLELSFAGYRFSYNLITAILQTKYYQECGVLQLACNNQLLKQQNQIINTNLPDDFCYKVSPHEIKQLTGLTAMNTTTGLFFPRGLWLNPPSLVTALCNHPNIKVVLNHKIDQLSYNENTWHLFQQNTLIDQAANVVICNSHALNQFAQTTHLQLRKIRGQISILQGNLGLKTVICGNGYITPNFNDRFTIGATFKFNTNNLGILDTEHKENIENLTAILPSLAEITPNLQLTGQANFRSSTTDYLPLVGPIADYAKFTQAYSSLAKDANYWIETPCPYLPGLFINAAHGAKGILTAPLCGEIIASYIDNTPLPISNNLQKALHPNRFWLKQIIKHKNQ